jgi:hypothetical protein
LLADNNDLWPHYHNSGLGYHCCLCYSFLVRVIEVLCSFEPWSLTRQPADITACVVAWRTPLEYHCIPKSTPFQSCLTSTFLKLSVSVMRWQDKMKNLTLLHL